MTEPGTAASEEARWCRLTRAAIAQMTDAELAVTFDEAAPFTATSPAYAAVHRMAVHEARKVRGWTAAADGQFRIPDDTIVTGTRSDIAGERHTITGYNPQTRLYTAQYMPAGPLTAAGARSPGLQRQLHAHEFTTAATGEAGR